MGRKLIRRLGGYMLLLVVAPLLLLAGAEVCLRVFGYGQSMRPFVKRQLDGHQFYVRNLAFVEQFLSWRLPLDNWEQVEHVVFREKPPNAYRIFVFGESTPEGWPDPQYSFSRFLRIMLHAQFPDLQIEVYNTAFRAVNSHVMRVQAAASVKFAPDLFIVYLGNNEVHGPFGATKTDAGPDPLLSLASIRAQIRLSDFRLFQAAQRTRRKMESGRGIEDVRARWHNRVCTDWSDPRVATILDYFARNLRDICETGTSAGASVVLCTVPVNLRHWRPVGSIHPAGFPASEEARWQALYTDGQAKQEEGAYGKALALYEQAAGLDATFADLQYRMGQCYWQVSEHDRARTCFERALEYDAFPWVRSRARTNEIIVQTSRGMASQGVHLADVKEAIASRSPHGCPGAELFFDYCHLNMDGTYLMAAALYRSIAPLVAAQNGRSPDALADPLSFEECLRRLALSPALLSGYLRQAIDSPDPYDEEGRAIMRQQLAEAQQAEGDDPYNSSFEMYREALTLNAEDYLLRYWYVNALVARFPFGYEPTAEPDPSLLEALEEAEAFAHRYPYHRGSLRLLGEAQSKTGNLEDALGTFRRTLQLYPHDLTTYRDWAALLLAANRPDDAWRVIRKAPKSGAVGDVAMLKQQKARVREALGDREGAIDLLAEAIELWPDYAPQYVELEKLLADKPERLVSIWQGLLQALTDKKLDKKRVYFHLGRARISLREIPEALKAYRDATDNHQDNSLNEEIADDLIQAGKAFEKEAENEAALLLYREAQLYAPGNLDQAAKVDP